MGSTYALDLHSEGGVPLASEARGFKRAVEATRPTSAATTFASPADSPCGEKAEMEHLPRRVVSVAPPRRAATVGGSGRV